MQITGKLAKKACSNAGEPAVTIAFLGDSVTQGCFELIKRNDTGFTTVHDRQNAYPAFVERILAVLYPTVPVNIIHAGVAGQSAADALGRLMSDVIAHKPDLTVVCFGLNDCGRGMQELAKYVDPLDEIFARLEKAGSEIIFLAPNMMSTRISPHLNDDMFREIARETSRLQNDGVLKQYIDAARALCRKHGIPVCDCYEKWELLWKNGVDVTELLSNRINHPIREMHWLFAVSLVETMMR